MLWASDRRHHVICMQCVSAGRELSILNLRPAAVSLKLAACKAAAIPAGSSSRVFLPECSQCCSRALPVLTVNPSRGALFLAGELSVVNFKIYNPVDDALSFKHNFHE
jgi:hypothetical protein